MQRVVRATALMFGEGKEDQVFLSHLVTLYAAGKNSTRPKLTVRKGRGGSADGIVQDARKVPGNFNRRLVKLDQDKSQGEIDEAIRIAEHYHIQLVFSKPCLEGMLLSILEPNNSYADKSSSYCKSRFEGKYIQAAKRGLAAPYMKLFTRDLLDQARSRVIELDELILYIETC